MISLTLGIVGVSAVAIFTVLWLSAPWLRSHVTPRLYAWMRHHILETPLRCISCNLKGHCAYYQASAPCKFYVVRSARQRETQSQ